MEAKEEREQLDVSESKKDLLNEAIFQKKATPLPDDRELKLLNNEMDEPLKRIASKDEFVAADYDGTDGVKEVNQQEEGKKNLTDPDPYFYIKRNEFTSEIYKIEILNLPKRFGFAQLKKRLLSLQLTPNKIKAIPNKNYAFVTFRSEEDREQALKSLNGHTWKGSILKAKRARPNADPLIAKQKKTQGAYSEPPLKKQKMDEVEENLPVDTRVKNAAIPLWNVPYEDQLNLKSTNMRSMLRRLARHMHQICHKNKDWLHKQRKLYDNMCCEMLPIKESPVLDGYRNKCEFTVGTDPEGTVKTVGFRIGRYSDGSSHVGEPYCCRFLPDKMKQVVKAFQDFIWMSKYAAFEPHTHEGHWRQLAVRTSRCGHAMAVAEFHPQQLSQEAIEDEMQRLREYFTASAGINSGVTSLYFLCHSERISGVATEAPLQHLFGDQCITEDLLGMKFMISPNAFFQVNTAAAEVLYEQVAEMCGPSPTKVLLDICCGTGTIGLTMAKKVHKVYGIEMCQQAVDDAKRNAEINGVTNAKFCCAKAEDAIHNVMRSLAADDVIAILDPPRAGLHSKVIQAIRKCAHLSKVVYLACNPAGAMQNFQDLTRSESQRVKGTPFIPVRAVPVDLFPFTNYCELVVLFERERRNSDPVLSTNVGCKINTK